MRQVKHFIWCLVHNSKSQEPPGAATASAEGLHQVYTPTHFQPPWACLTTIPPSDKSPQHCWPSRQNGATMEAMYTFQEPVKSEHPPCSDGRGQRQDSTGTRLPGSRRGHQISIPVLLAPNPSPEDPGRDWEAVRGIRPVTPGLSYGGEGSSLADNRSG